MSRHEQHWVMDPEMNAQTCEMLHRAQPRTAEQVIARAYRRSAVLLILVALLIGAAITLDPLLALPAVLLMVPGFGFRLAGFVASQHATTCRQHEETQ